MEKYEKYLTNPFFMKWIFNADTSAERYWSNYIIENPSEKRLLLTLKNELEALKLESQELSELEKHSLLQNILQKNDVEITQTIGKRRFALVLKYAAIAFLFFVAGNGIMYFYLQKKDTGIQFAQTYIDTIVSKPTLILSDGFDIELESLSTINHQQDSILLVDNNLVRESKNQEKETSLNQLIIPFGNRSQITLEDGTKVFLNAGSKLIYPSKFMGEQREVFLFGEAFFEVHKNPEVPFVVNTTSIQAKVLGTKFNISSYPKDNIVKTVLVEGSVVVKRNNARLFEKEIQLEPNQLVAFNKETKEYKSSFVNTNFYTSWKDGIIVFEDEDFGRLIKRVEHFYNIKFKFHNPVKSTVKVSGKLNLEEDKQIVFNYMEILTKMKIEKINENYYEIK